MGWEERWVRWPDFRLPTDQPDARDALCEAWRRAGLERCRHLRRRVRQDRQSPRLSCGAGWHTGDKDVAFVREHFDPGRSRRQSSGATSRDSAPCRCSHSRITHGRAPLADRHLVIGWEPKQAPLPVRIATPRSR